MSGNRTTSTLARRLLLLFSSIMAVASTDALAETVPEPFDFAVTLNDRSLGSVSYRFEAAQNGLAVNAETRLDFRLAFVSLFRYRHHVSELWQNGCLTSLESSTNDNGDRYAVTAERRADGLLVRRSLPESGTDAKTDSAEALLTQDCPATFAYWDPELLMRQQLLNAQTGKLEPVTVRDLGVEDTNGEPQRHLVVELSSAPEIHLWYRASDQRWQRLENEVPRGTIVYTAQSAADN